MDRGEIGEAACRRWCLVWLSAEEGEQFQTGTKVVSQDILENAGDGLLCLMVQLAEEATMSLQKSKEARQ